MRISPITTTALAVGLLVMPIAASAQHSLTGQLVEQLPGGGSFTNVSITMLQVGADGFPNPSATNLSPCFGGATTNCIQTDGRFTALNLQPGLHILRVLGSTSNGSHLDRLVNATVNGATDMGIIPMIRTPFNVLVALGQIPAAGGTVPVTVRVRRRWDIPTLPISARVSVMQQTSSWRGDFADTPKHIDFTWPVDLADSGVIPLTTVSVPPTAPPGALSCVDVTIFLRGQPDFVLGRHQGCQGKRP